MNHAQRLMAATFEVLDRIENEPIPDKVTADGLYHCDTCGDEQTSEAKPEFCIYCDGDFLPGPDPLQEAQRIAINAQEDYNED